MTSVGPRCGETGAHVVLTGKVPLLQGDWGCWKHAEGLRDTYMFSCAFWLLHGCQGQFAGSGLMGGAYWPFSMQWGGGGAEGVQHPRKDIHQNPKRRRSSHHSACCHVLLLCQAPVSGELALSLRSCLF